MGPERGKDGGPVMLPAAVPDPSTTQSLSLSLGPWLQSIKGIVLVAETFSVVVCDC